MDGDGWANWSPTACENCPPKMAVRLTTTRFPMEPDEQDSSGLVWGVTVTPFSRRDENGNPPAMGSNGEALPRCDNCWAYFNYYCELDQWAWSCSLCGTLNGLSTHAIAKYSRPKSCPEMISSFIDLDLPRLQGLLWRFQLLTCKE